MRESSQLTSIKDLFNKISGNQKLQFIRRWNYIQRTFKMDDLVVIDFEDTDVDQFYWRCYFNNNSKLYESRRRATEALVDSFLGLGFKNIDDTFFKYTVENERWLGFFMPRPEWSEHSLHHTEQTINKLQIFKKYFDFRSFLENLFKENPVLESNEDRILNAFWMYGLEYKEFLANFHNNSKGNEDFKDLWYLSIFDLDDFSDLLPSEQITYLMFIAYESSYSIEVSNLFYSLIKESSSEVQSFFSEHKNFFLSQTTPGKQTHQYKYAIKKFISIAKEDKNQFYLNKIVDSKTRSVFSGLPQEIHTYFNKDFDYSNSVESASFKDTFQSLLSKLNIFDRINKSVLKYKLNFSDFSPPAKVIYNKGDIKWVDVKIKEELLRQKSLIFSSSEQSNLKKSIELSWQNHLMNLGNAITCPFFRVEKSSDSLFFKWNTINQNRGRVFVAEYQDKLQQEREEDRKCGEHIDNVKQLYNLEDAIKYAKRVPSFTFQHIQERWEKELRSALAEIKRKSAKRIRRMREFGILIGNEQPTLKMHIYLNEILAVEEEVKPYLTFVKKAFQSALPVKKMTHFDQYRNSHVGVEFDPETVFDQNKWQRGEVMKILKRKTVYGNVQQVNTFCLDFSGSMTHNRMRNLFKILFLIITGLEDRKVYNSIHFFNEKFIPGVELSLRYADRKTLFKILSQISNIADKAGRVIYKGIGGTNIYAGLKSCHDRIIKFSEDLYARKTEEGITKSIFLISDGEPTLGITDIPELADLIRDMRRKGDVSIKGIYIKPENDTSTFISRMLGEGHYVENTSFEEGVNNFVSIMTKTFEAQRKEFKNKKRAQKVFGARGARR